MWKSPVLLILLAGTVGTANAHHGINGQFDTSQTFEVSGMVTRLALVNPHSYVYFDVTGDDGAAIPWRCEMRAGSLLRRSGWSEVFSPGAKITIFGSPDRVDEQTCYMMNVTFEDGTTLDRYAQVVPADVDDVAPVERPLRLADGQLNLAGTWGTAGEGPPPGIAGNVFVTGSRAVVLERLGMGMGMGAFAPPSVQPTAAGLAAIEGLTHVADNPRFHCMAVNIFHDWTFDRHINEILQTENTITLKYGFMDLVRMIHMTLAQHPADIMPTRAGHSIGRWEDDVLVVDTVGFDEGFIVAGPGGIVKHSDELHTVEQFSYDPENMTLHRSYVAEDPLYLTGQFTGEDTVGIADSPFDPYNCDDLTNEHINVGD